MLEIRNKIIVSPMKIDRLIDFGFLKWLWYVLQLILSTQMLYGLIITINIIALINNFFKNDIVLNDLNFITISLQKKLFEKIIL